MKTNSFNSLMMVISLIIYWIVPSKSWAQVQVDGICYNLYPWDNLAGVTSNPNNYSGSIVIPNSIVYSGNTYSVFSIDSEAFSNCTELTSVDIPSSVTSIGESAFYGCKGLTSISIPSSVTSIGNSAFYECTGLTSMAIPNSVTSIGGYAFYGCTDLTSIEIPSSVTVIGGYAFHNTAWYYHQPEGLIYINNVAYEYKWEAYEDASFNIALRNGTVSISGGAFSNYMVGLKSIVIPNTVTSIGDYAFAGCTGLTSLFIPNSVTSIGQEAFSYCTGLTSINVCWETLWDIDIDYGAFDFDKTACTLYVPIGSKSEYEAYGWEDFKNIVERSPVRDTGSCGDNVSYTIYPDYHMVISGMGQMWMDGWDEWLPKAYCNVLQEVIIEDGVTSIGLCAFSDCTGLTSVTIPNSVTSIGGSAFSDCTGLTSVTIPNSVTSIGSSAFMRCTGLTSIEIPNSLTSIDDDTFNGCTGLTSVTIPSSVTSIGSSAFYGCTGLTSVTISSSVTSIDYDAFYATPWYHRQPNGLVYINNVAYKYKGKIPEGTAIALRAGTVSISGTAFSGCTGLTSIEIPNSVTSIGYRAFYNCTGLTSIKVGWEAPLALSYFSDVFDNIDRTVCTLYVPAGSKTSYERAYIWNTFSNIVEYIPTLATGSCGDNVTYTIFSDMSMVISGTGAMTDFTINYDDDTINRENNEYWTQAKTVTIEEGVTSIGNYAFSNCTELISVSIPNSVTSIGSSAFLGCEALTSITIPASVETIGADALSYTGLTHIYIEDCDDVLQFEQVTSYMEDYEDPLEYVYLGRNIKTMSFNEDDPWEGVEGNPPFSRSRNLHTLEIGDKVTYLEDWSFSSAPLESLVIGSNVQSIGIRALSSANVGQTLVIPSNVKRMGDYSLSPSISTLVLEKGSDDLELFAGYNSLELSFFGSESSIDSIYVGRNLTCSSNNIHVVCRSACFDAPLRRTMNTSGEEEEFDLTEYYIPPVCATKYYFRSGASVGEYYFQNSPVEHVYNLRSSRVGNYAFFNSNVKTVSFDAEGSTTIGNGVFSDCNGLTTLSFPEGMTDIGDNAFMNCSGLTSITIPSSLQSIGGYSFYMEGIENRVPINVYISDLSAWCSMDIGFLGSPLIWGHLIYNGEEITDLVVPEDVQSIGMGAFDGYSSLTSVVIPESVTSIGERAFYCTGLTSVTMESAVPLTIEGSTFEEVDKTNCILYVPSGSKTAYESASGWREFENIVEYDSDPDTDISDYDNIVYIEGAEAVVGQQVRLSVKMNNTVDVAAFQFNLVLPEGITVSTDDYGDYLIELSETRTSLKRHTLSSALQSDGSINVLCSSQNVYTFTGSEGEVASIVIDIDPTIEEGSYPLILKRIVMSDDNSNTYKVEYVKTTLTISSYTLGDVNNDGDIDVGDFTAIANYILNKPSNTFLEKAADVNVDGSIDVGDLTGVANIILYGSISRNSSNAKSRDEITSHNADMEVEQITATSDKEFTVSIDINGNYAFSGYQFDVSLPEGLTVKNVSEQSNASNLFMSQMIDDNTLRVLGASSTGKTTESTVLYLTLEAEVESTYNVIIDNAVISANASTCTLNNCSFLVGFGGDATGISNLSDEADNTDEAYDLIGNKMKYYGKMSNLQKGIYIINGNKVLIK